MSFSSEVKEELVKKTDSARHCQIEEFAAFMGLHMYLRRECLDGMGGIIIVGRSLVRDCLKE